jgi:hypothetical protein
MSLYLCLLSIGTTGVWSFIVVFDGGIRLISILLRTGNSWVQCP